MANYLPVLLVSVTANATPDDNALTTVPRGQVDYLSHDWQEEDVWRSWRNMTRQKNEIANGVRLENASWRTWWKQRNKLKTISPATLNWLKDSDVTWLYGPLHTAVDWTPPSKPKEASDHASDSSTHGTLNRPSSSTSTLQPTSTTQPPRTKPILKYRSIGELLTSALPVSSLFSPYDSEDDSRPTFSSASEEDHPQPLPTTSLPQRPALVHTKSDTHITRWGPSRAFRKDSPPRVVPPSTSREQSSLSSKQTKLVHVPSSVRNSLSQDSASSTSGGSSERKKKHISFNTFVEQCIAIEKPKHRQRSKRRTGDFEMGEFIECEDEEYDSEDDDGEDDDDNELWGNTWHDGNMDGQLAEGSVTSIYGGNTYTPYRSLAGSAVYTDSDSDDAIEIRPASYRRSSISGQTLKRKATSRSKSVSSSSSTTSTTTTTSGSSSGKPAHSRRKSESAAVPITLELLQPPHQSAYRPRPINFPDAISRDRVTIAPIAPTLLKTTGAWEEGFGDEDGISDDGLFDFGLPRHGVSNKSRNSVGSGAKRQKTGVGGEERREEDFSSEGTPVELVYVPPFGSIYGVNAMNYWTGRDKAVGDDEDVDEEMEGVEGVRSQILPPSGEKRDQEQVMLSAEMPVEQDASMQVMDVQNAPTNNAPLPILLVNPAQSGKWATGEGDELVNEEDREASEKTPTAVSRTPNFVASSQKTLQDEDTEFRGRSLSVSPVGNDGTRTPSFETPPGGGSTFASRGRSQSFQDLPSLHRASLAVASASASQSADRGDRRGRAGLRTPSGASASSGSRGHTSSSRSISHQSHSGGPTSRNGSLSPNNASTSPMGSLSPDGSDNGSRLGGIGNAYAGGRIGGRERERGGGSSSSLNTSGRGGEERRGRDKGRRVLVAEYNSGAGGSGSSTSPAAPLDGTSENSGRGRTRRRLSVSPSDVNEVGVPLALEDSKGKGKEEELKQRQQAGTSVASDSGSTIIEMDSSTCSASSEGSTVVPSQRFASSPSSVQTERPVSVPESHVRIDGKEELDQEVERRKSVPTPSNTPEIGMTAPRFAATLEGAGKATNSTIVQAPSSTRSPGPIARHVLASSLQSQSTPRSGSKTRSSPPIAPSPPHPVLPSTSTSYVPGELDPPSLTTAIGGKRFSTSLDRASSGSTERGSPTSTSPRTGSSRLRRDIGVNREREGERELAEARRGRSASVDVRDVRAGDANDYISPVARSERERETIIGKAVGMVSNAYSRLWQNH